MTPANLVPVAPLKLGIGGGAVQKRIDARAKPVAVKDQQRLACTRLERLFKMLENRVAAFDPAPLGTAANDGGGDGERIKIMLPRRDEVRKMLQNRIIPRKRFFG